MTEPEQQRRRPGRPATGTTPGHNVPMPTHRWNRLGEVAAALDADRTKLLNLLAAWFMREPGAKLPKRPEPPAGE